MSTDPPYRGNGPTGGTVGEAEESDDLKAIRRDSELYRLSQDVSQHVFPEEDDFRREFEEVAKAAQDWEVASYDERFRALRILARRFGVFETFQLAQFAATRSMQDWFVTIRPRADHEMSDSGKRRKRLEREFLDNLVGREVYSRMKAGQSKAEAIASMREDYRTGAPIPSAGGFPPPNRPVITFAGDDAIEKRLARYRKAARRRGYVDPYAALHAASSLREPELKLSDIPGRGRRSNK